MAGEKSKQYKQIWNKIKTNLKAEVTVSKEYAPTLIQGVIRTKCADNVGRHGVGLISFARMKIKREEISGTMLKVTFELGYDSRI